MLESVMHKQSADDALDVEGEGFVLVFESLYLSILLLSAFSFRALIHGFKLIC
jgi:hypothetical protein